MIEDTAKYPAELLTIAFPKQSRELRVQVIRDVLWYRGSKTEPVMVVLVRDPLGQWRDEALVATDPTATAAFVILGYCRRWSVELAFFDSKQHLGLHDPRVRSERSVERAHPMAWFVGSLVILWYCVKGHRGLPRGQGPPVVHDEGHADVHGHAGSVTVADVGVRGLWRVRRGSALAGMHQTAAPHALSRRLRSESLVSDKAGKFKSEDNGVISIGVNLRRVKPEYCFHYMRLVARLLARHAWLASENTRIGALILTAPGSCLTEANGWRSVANELFLYCLNRTPGFLDGFLPSQNDRPMLPPGTDVFG